MLDFIIPISKDELLTPNGQRYVPTSICNPGDLGTKFQECSRAIQEDGFKFIFDHFDSLFSMLVHFHRLETGCLASGWSVILKGFKRTLEDLTTLLKPNKALENKERIPALNAMKMTTYLLTQSMSSLEDRCQRLSLAKGKKKGKHSDGGDEMAWWAKEEETAFFRLYDLLHLPLVWLWDPPSPEESFFHLLSDAGFKALEKQTILQVKSASLRETILHIFGLMVRRYSYGFSITIRMVQVLNTQEHLATPMVQCTHLLLSEYGCHNVVREMVRELSEMYSAGDVPASAARSHGQYFAELAEAAPAALAEQLDLIWPLLEQEQHSLRNGILAAASSVVVHCLTKDNLNENEREQRDELLELLQTHMLDSSALVRSKVLQLWRWLSEERAVPQSIRCAVLERASSRILDTSSAVRKSALQLVTTFLQQTPNAVQVGASELEHQLEVEVERLGALKERFRKGNPQELRWLEMCAPLQVALQKHFENELEGSLVSDSAEEVDDEEEMEEGNKKKKGERTGKGKEKHKGSATDRHIQACCLALEQGKYVRAYKHIVQVEQDLPQELVAQRTTELEGRVGFYTVLLGQMFLQQSSEQPVLGAGAGLLMDTAPSQQLQQEQQELVVQEKLVTYLSDSLQFVKCMGKAVAQLQRMVQWAVGQTGPAAAEILAEAAQLVEVAHKAQLPGAVDCVRFMMRILLHEPESTVVTAVAELCHTVYFTYDPELPVPKQQQVVLSLMDLLSGATRGDYLALKELMKQWVSSGDITGPTVQAMWDIFLNPNVSRHTAGNKSKAAGEVPPPAQDRQRQRLLALALLTAVAAANAQAVRGLLPELSARVLRPGVGTSPDLRLAAQACEMLLATCPPLKHSQTGGSTQPRLPVDHDLFVRLLDLLLQGFGQLEDPYFTPLALSALSLAYQLCLSPETFSEKLLSGLCSSLWSQGPPANEVMNGESSSEALHSVPNRALARLLSVAGHTAMLHMVFLDTAVYRKLKTVEVERATAKSKHGPACSNMTKLGRSSVRGRRTGNTVAETDTSSSSIGMNGSDEGSQGTQAEDRVAESIRNVCESELLAPDSLLGVLLPIVVSVVSKRTVYHDAELQRAAQLALSKMMMVSSTVCSDNMQLFVTAMSSCTDEAARAQAVISMADITFRFPNVVEPWTRFMYDRLRDQSDHVRLTAVHILSRLIMSDMVKVRGQISDLALCLDDSNASIVGAAKSFFKELSQKGNVLYNVLPDIISRLSAPDQNLTEETFKTVLTFLLEQIGKERQVEQLVDKLCQRFPGASTDRQAADLALCLSLLSYSQRALRKLLDSLPLYADKLHLLRVQSCFSIILTAHTKPSAKPDIKAVADELELAMEEYLKRGAIDPDATSSRPLGTARTAKTPARGGRNRASGTKSVKKPRTKKIVWSSSSDEGE